MEEIWRGWCLFEIEKNSRVNELIAITKSNSGISGPSLENHNGNTGTRYDGRLMCD